MVAKGTVTRTGIEILRAAPNLPRAALRFDVWMALVNAAPLRKDDAVEAQMAF